MFKIIYCRFKKINDQFLKTLLILPLNFTHPQLLSAPSAVKWHRVLNEETEPILLKHVHIIRVLEPDELDKPDMARIRDRLRIKFVDTFSSEEMKEAADLVAQTIVKEKWNSLEGHSLSEIRDWAKSDETTSNLLREALKQGSPLPNEFKNKGFQGGLVVSAAIMESAYTDSDPTAIQKQMISYLKTMHEFNDQWKKFEPLNTDPEQAPKNTTVNII